MSDPAPPGLEFVAAVTSPLPHRPVGSGPNPRGTRLSGKVLSGGADVQLLRSDGVMEIDAKYLIETDPGAPVFVRNTGIARGGPNGLYFRSSPSFETSAPDLQWLMQHVFVGTASVSAGPAIELRWYKVT